MAAIDENAPPTERPADPDYVPPQDSDYKAPDDVDEEEDVVDVKAPADPNDVEDVLEPKVDHVIRIIVDDRGQTGTYTQKPLTYFGKIELYGILGRAVRILMEDNGLGFDEIMDMASPKNMIDQIVASMPGADTAPDRDSRSINAEQAAKMMSAFARVVSVAPDLLMEAYCVVLHIPKGHRPWAMDWGLPAIDDETGSDIAHTFIDQNWGVMQDFFGKELPNLFKRAAKARARHASPGAR